jgi:hypothetical protein
MKEEWSCVALDHFTVLSVIPFRMWRYIFGRTSWWIQSNVLLPCSGWNSNGIKQQQEQSSMQTELGVQSLIQLQTCEGAQRQPIGATRNVTTVLCGPTDLPSLSSAARSSLLLVCCCYLLDLLFDHDNNDGNSRFFWNVDVNNSRLYGVT